jgi:hypothetical protein
MHFRYWIIYSLQAAWEIEFFENKWDADDPTTLWATNTPDLKGSSVKYHSTLHSSTVPMETSQFCYILCRKIHRPHDRPANSGDGHLRSVKLPHINNSLTGNSPYSLNETIVRLDMHTTWAVVFVAHPDSGMTKPCRVFATILRGALFFDDASSLPSGPTNNKQDSNAVGR